MPSSDGRSDGNPGADRFHSLLVEDEAEFCDLLECVLGLTEPNAELYRYVLANPDSTVEELSQAANCDPSTINRRLNTLHERALVTRHRNVLSKGGVIYRYEPTGLDQIEERMHQTIDDWATSMHGRIEAVLQR